MRAVVYPDFGSPPEVRELEVPEPGEGEIRVRVRAASVNGFDVAVAAGYLNGMMEHRFPVVLGKDFAGIVDAVGAGVTGYAPGERVFGVVTKAFLGDGSFGEYVTVPAAVGLAKLPDTVEFTDGAALGLAGTAALDAVAAAKLQAGQTVLVSGATGGVGSQTLQLASRSGARVLATAHSDEESAHVRGLGAAGTVDHNGDIAAQVHAKHPDGVDVVFHFAGDAAALLAVVRRGGHFVSTLLGGPDQVVSDTVTVVPVYANPVPETLDRLAVNQATGHTRVVVQRSYPLADAAAAFADFGAGTLGKLVIRTD